MESFNYTTTEGDRIDALAVKFYGGNHGISIIADANPAVPVTAVYPAGTVLIIPIVEDETVSNTTDLPPWKQ
jgi:phage tail protein X